MGYFSELDMWYKELNLTRPFDTPVHSKLIIKSYKEGREKINEIHNSSKSR